MLQTFVSPTNTMSLSLYHLILLLIFSLFISSVNSNSYDENSVAKACPSQSCGGITIKYPFWLQDDTNSDPYCGYKGFGLNCTAQNQTILSLQNEIYYVKSMDYTNYTLTLVDADVTSNQTCPRPRHNLTIDHLPLYYTSLDVNLSFYFNCSSHPPPEEVGGLIECLGLGVNRSYVYMVGSEPGGNDWYKSCEEKVVVTVIDQWEINNLTDLIGGFGRAMKEGFILNWGQMEYCDECEASDGACGYDQRTQNSLCFCSNGNIHSKNCKVTGSGSNMALKVIIGTSAAGVGLLVTCIIIYNIRSKTSLRDKLIIFWKKKTRDDLDLETFIRHYGSLAPKRFSYFDVKKMTKSFRDKLGEGGYGGVYKGKLYDGSLVAVKILKKSKGNGEEFINEVASISRTSHVNVVTLLGFCFEGHKRALIYEFMPNGSLEKFVYSSKNTSGHLGWEKMDQIVIGIARGLEYLHRGCNTRIVHFDIKPHNILLDEDFCPKIADFGLAKLCTKNESILSMLDARGTIGYIAPEVFSRNFGGVSHKSDVYSYGMMVLVMVGAKNKIDVTGSQSSENYFPHWVYRRLELDQDLLLSHGVMTREESEIVRKMIIVGLWCIQTDPLQRPSISKVIDMLEGSVEALQIPPKPFLSTPPRSPQDSSSTMVVDTTEEL